MIREGSDITLVGWGAQLSVMEQACIDAEKVNLFTYFLVSLLYDNGILYASECRLNFFHYFTYWCKGKPFHLALLGFQLMFSYLFMCRYFLLLFSNRVGSLSLALCTLGPLY